MLFYFFNHFNICALTLPLHFYDANSHYCSFVVEFVPEDGRKCLNT